MSAAQFYPTCCDLRGCSPPGSSVHGILQARILEWGAIPFSRGSSRPTNRTQVSCIIEEFFTTWAIREAPLEYSLFHTSYIELPTIFLCACLDLQVDYTLFKAASCPTLVQNLPQQWEFCWVHSKHLINSFWLTVYPQFLTNIKRLKVKVAQLCPTLCDPMDYTVHGILQARILEWVAFPFCRGSSQPRDWTQISRNAGGFFTS